MGQTGSRNGAGSLREELGKVGQRRDGKVACDTDHAPAKDLQPHGVLVLADNGLLVAAEQHTAQGDRQDQTVERTGQDDHALRAAEDRHDIIQAVELGSREGMVAFCKGIQSAAPVDSYVTPEPWAMPGYDSEVIMAAGAFVQGSSIELSADGPVREPYAVYYQGGLTWYHAKLGVLLSLQKMLDAGLITLP